MRGGAPQRSDTLVRAIAVALIVAAPALWLWLDARDRRPSAPAAGDPTKAERAEAPPARTSAAPLRQERPADGPRNARANESASLIHELRGVVRDERDRPVEAFRVHARPLAQAAAAAPTRGATSRVRAPDGAFVLRLRAAPPWSLTVEAHGFQTATLQADTATAEQVVRLQRPALLFGRVLAPNAEPLEGIELECVDAQGRTVDRTLSSVDGDYELHPAEPGTFYVHVLGQAASPPLTPRPGAPVSFDVHPPAATTVRVSVLSPDGFPLEAATVLLLVGRGTRTVRSGPDGAATFYCVPRGDHRLRASARGFAELRARVSTFEASQQLFTRQLTLRRGGR